MLKSDFRHSSRNLSKINLTNIVQGHVEKFADFMVKDMKSGICHRADKLIEDHIEKLLAKKKDMKKEEKEKLEKIMNDAGAYRMPEIDKVIKELNMKAPDTGNDLSESLPFNLMFET